jgi:DNA-binding NarL/FixJ family response regulator
MLQAIVQFAAPTPMTGAVTAEAGTFTTREVEILVHLARGLSNREIGEALFLSPRTVERHLENVYRKGGFRNRAEATAYAVTNKLLDRG